MKKEKIDDNQLTFFDVIDGGKHEEDKKNIMKFKKKQLIDVQYAPYEEMFSGFNKIQAITFSYDLSFINNIMKYFRQNRCQRPAWRKREGRGVSSFPRPEFCSDSKAAWVGD